MQWDMTISALTKKICIDTLPIPGFDGIRNHAWMRSVLQPVNALLHSRSSCEMRNQAAASHLTVSDVQATSLTAASVVIELFSAANFMHVNELSVKSSSSV